MYLFLPGNCENQHAFFFHFSTNQQNRWFNCGLDMLECSFCHAKLCIRVDSQLTIKSHEHVVRYWESMLRKGGHTKDDMCLFRDSSKAESDDLDGSEIPLYLASVLDPSFVGLMEHPRPKQLLLERSDSLIPKLDTISNFEPLDLEDRDMVEDIASRTNLQYDIIQLILGNWTWDESNNEFLCRVCHTTFRGHVIKSHKYYCPVRCGYGNGGPSTWTILAKKVFQSSDSPLENKDGLEQLKAILTDK
jgi:hypothetical protein